MKFFDCNASFGTPMVPPIRYAETAQELLEEMDHYGIDQALVHHARQCDDSPVVGNSMLLDGIEGKDRLHGTLAVLPPQTGELGTPESLLGLMGEKGIRALWAFPAEHRYSLSRTTLGGLYELMTDRRIPLFLNRGESSGVGGWHLVEKVLSDVPDLTLIVTEHGSWGEDRLFRPLFENYANLYLDISRYELDGGIRDFVGKYGAERLLFGTAFPHWNAGGPILTLMHADIAEKEKETIASGNLERILGRVRL
jgi:predicted TIM-barrel fold metal-dependent hydrolase